MDNIPIAARMLSLRVLSNMFVHPHSRRCILSHSSRVSGIGFKMTNRRRLTI